MKKRDRRNKRVNRGKAGNPNPPEPMPAKPLVRQDYLFILSLAAMVWCVNAVWLWLDSRPPVWDMAMHQMYALNYWPGSGELPSAQPISSYSGIYPPFVHILIALAYLLFHPAPDIAALSNLPATILLLWAVYSLASDMAGRGAARWTAFLTSMIPYLFWMSRETILDYWLSALVAASLVVLRRTESFRERRPSIILGTLLGLGLLTKWLFAAFLGFPMLYVFLREFRWNEKRRLFNFGLTLGITGALSAIWYVPNFANLLRYFPENARIGEMEGEPPVLSFQSAIYYIRLLEGYQLFALLFALLAFSLVMVCRRGMIRDGKFLGVAIGGAWLVLTLIRTKDPRFTMPLLGLFAIVPGAWVASWKAGSGARMVKLGLLSILVFQAYAINFGIPWLPEEIILAKGYQGSLRWDWNLYLQHYFHILGAPRQEEWRQAEILNRVERDAKEKGLRPTLALVPDLPRFSATNFMLVARLLGQSTGIGRLILTKEAIYPLDAVDYVVTADGEQGMTWTTTTSLELNRIIETTPAFQLVERFPLPGSNFARLYRVRHEEIRSGR